MGKIQADFIKLTASLCLHQPGGGRKMLLRPLVQHIDDFDRAVGPADRAGIKQKILQPFIRLQANLTLPGQRQVQAAKGGVFAYVARNIPLLRCNVARPAIT